MMFLLFLYIILANLISHGNCQSTTTNLTCGILNGIEYQCESGTTCCNTDDCCSSFEFCFGAISYCINYFLIVFAPLSLLFFLISCFFNYRHKSSFLRDIRSLKELKEKCMESLDIFVVVKNKEMQESNNGSDFVNNRDLKFRETIGMEENENDL